MKTVTSRLRHYRLSPRKIQILGDLIRGREVGEAMKNLSLARKRAAPALRKLLSAAVANAKHNFKIAEPERLIVSTFAVDEGPTLKRYRPRARGSAATIRKRTSHVTIVLTEDRGKRGVHEGSKKKDHHE